MRAIDQTLLYQKYGGKWVALKDDKVTVISSGKKLDTVIRKAAEKGFKDPVFFKVPAENGIYIGSL